MPTCLALTGSLTLACTHPPPVPFCGVNSDLTPKIPITDFVKIHIVTMKSPWNPYLKPTPTHINLTAQRSSGPNVADPTTPLEPPADISVGVAPSSLPKRSYFIDVMVAGDDAPMPRLTFTHPGPPSLHAYRSTLGLALRSADDVIHAPSSPIAPTALL